MCLRFSMVLRGRLCILKATCTRWWWQARQRFGFFLDALTYGTPPHGGIALGLDRVAMLLAGEKSLREVIAFPKTAQAQDLMAEAPNEVSDAQLDELGITRKKKS